jgi:hypothetical protein
MTYYNTTHETDPDLTVSRTRARNQQDRVLDFFHHNPTGMFTTREIHEKVFHNYGEVTSTQRCITNLTDEGKLLKSKETVPGKKYGKRVHAWSYNSGDGDRQQQLNLF